jgi:hypothetical protein
MGAEAVTCAVQWEFREVSLSRDTSREDVRQQLTDAADTGRWELDRLHLLPDGRRVVRLRRRVYRMQRTA